MFHWLEQHPLLILTAIAVTAFIESFALVGIVVPGVVLLFSLATLAGNTDIAWPWVLLAAAFGACAGDMSSFFIGRRLQHRIDHLAWFRRHRHWLHQGEWFFRRWGWLSVIIGRFLGPIRPVVPLIAGTLNMPRKQFISLNLVSVLAWAPVYVLPGYLTGEAATLLEGRSLAERTLAVIAVAAGCILLAVLTINHHLHPEHPATRRWFPVLKRIPVRFPFSSLLLILACIVALTGLVLARPLLWDPVLAAQVPAWRATAAADNFFLGFTLLGDPAILILTGGLIALWFLIKGYYGLTVHLLVVIALAHSGVFALKELFDVARPDWVISQPGGRAFPSGHAAGFALYLGLLSAFANDSRPQLARWQLYLPAGALMLAMAFSRVWLGVHWLSDVLGGVLLALLLSGMTRVSYTLFSDRRVTLAGTGAFWSLVLLTFAAYAVLAWPEARFDYALQ